jgi:hypothetical protein
MITVVPCPHCGESKTRQHCENPQCTWITCLNCRKVTAVKKTGET